MFHYAASAGHLQTSRLRIGWGMAGKSDLPKLVLTAEEEQRPGALRTSRAAAVREVQRARILWPYPRGHLRDTAGVAGQPGDHCHLYPSDSPLLREAAVHRCCLFFGFGLQVAMDQVAGVRLGLKTAPEDLGTAKHAARGDGIVARHRRRDPDVGFGNLLLAEDDFPRPGRSQTDCRQHSAGLGGGPCVSDERKFKKTLAMLCSLGYK